nr:class A beta-lactamase-related serine hydrolase [Lentilactobacillus otakiensis]
MNQTSLKSGYNLYASGPYNTSAGNVRAVANGSKYNNDYVRVMQTKTTKTGSYARLRYFNQYLGWMNVHGIKRVSFTQVARGTMQQYDVIGTAALEPYTNQPPVIVSTGYADKAHGVLNSGTGSVVYPLASLQKAMTAVMIQQLIDEGKLTASTLLSKYYHKCRTAVVSRLPRCWR